MALAPALGVAIATSTRHFPKCDDGCLKLVKVKESVEGINGERERESSDHLHRPLYQNC